MLMLIFITTLYHTLGVSAVSTTLLFNIEISGLLDMFIINVKFMKDITLIIII